MIMRTSGRPLFLVAGAILVLAAPLACGTVEPEEFRPAPVVNGARGDLAAAVADLLAAPDPEAARPLAERVESLALEKAAAGSRPAAEALRVRAIRYAAELPERRDENTIALTRALDTFLALGEDAGPEPEPAAEEPEG